MKVLYGMDYLRSEREEQHALLRAALMDHISHHPEALIVIEEYDKLDCATRGFFRQLLENARSANVTLDRYQPPHVISDDVCSFELLNACAQGDRVN